MAVGFQTWQRRCGHRSKVRAHRLVNRLTERGAGSEAHWPYHEFHETTFTFEPQLEARLASRWLVVPLRFPRWGGGAIPASEPHSMDASRSLQVAHPKCVREIHATFEGTILALGQALELRDFETKGHTERVVAWTDRLTTKLRLDEPERRAVRWGAYLHDIGKLAIPDSILLKPGHLDESEWATMRAHAVHGVRMLRDVPALPDETRDVVCSHHERWDGAGYPDGLTNEEIPRHARLFSLVDVWDALTHERTYKEAWSRADARAEIERGAGSQFDPELATLFLTIEAETAARGQVTGVNA